MITVNKIDELLKYFHQELAYLRNKGGEFAERYPKIAGALELGPDGSTDPHVEWLYLLPSLRRFQTEGIIIQPDANSELQKVESVHPTLREIITK